MKQKRSRKADRMKLNKKECEKILIESIQNKMNSKPREFPTGKLKIIKTIKDITKCVDDGTTKTYTREIPFKIVDNDMEHVYVAEMIVDGVNKGDISIIKQMK